jgi:hypothetical protein
MPPRQNARSVLIYGLALYLALYGLVKVCNMLFSGFKHHPAHGALPANKRAPTKPFVIVTTTPEVPSVEEAIEDPWAMPFNHPA